MKQLLRFGFSSYAWLGWLAALGLTACGPGEQIVSLQVTDHETSRGLDSAVVSLEAARPGSTRKVIQTFATNEEGKLLFRYDREEDVTYWVKTERRFFQYLVNDKGDAYLHEAELQRGDSAIVTLQLEKIPLPNPELVSQMREEVGIEAVLASLRSNAWSYAMLPQLTWEDVPALLAAAGDTAQVTKYPSMPNTTYHPAKVRVGLVALWLVEAIRKMEMKGTDDVLHIVPPSRAPVLGTKEGNPLGYNSPEQVLRAQAAYQAWYESVQAAGAGQRTSQLLNIPLRNEGMSWM